MKRRLTREELTQERLQQRNEAKHHIYRGRDYDFHGLIGTALGVYPHGALFSFGRFRRFLTWWEIGKATIGELSIALRE